MNLSAEQRTALENGQPVTCVVDQTQCVVVRKDVFDRLSLVALDDWTPEEMRAIAERTFDAADSGEAIS